ncbi:MAG TPA: putative hydro-lyase, partial [Clostridia bacterium]|nr:putative hydro-lyase [Clostridia bacterium]
MKELAEFTPREARGLIRAGEYAAQTSGMCPGYAQCNLAAIPKEYADDFLRFTQLNPRPCPVLEVVPAGERLTKLIASGADVARDIPKYRVYEYGRLTGEYADASAFWRDDLVAFLIGCSFSFEDALLREHIPVRHIEQGRNVPMYNTNILLKSAGVFGGNMVVSMRPMAPEDAERAAEVTARFPRVHGAPVHVGDPKEIGIPDIGCPDYGDAVEIKPGETTVFWACGVTPQAAVMRAKL